MRMTDRTRGIRLVTLCLALVAAEEGRTLHVVEDTTTDVVSTALTRTARRG